MRQIVNFSLLVGFLLALSACQLTTEDNTPLNDLVKMATPNIERTAQGGVIYDRLPMIRYDENQPCTKDLTPLARVNAQAMTIEQCSANQWKTIGTLNYDKPTFSKEKPVKKATTAKVKP